MSLKKIILTLIAIALQTTYAQGKNLVMLDPAGHAQSTGRSLWQGFERAETLAFCKRLELHLQALGIDAECTRKPGETLVPLQSASYSNRCKSSCFVRIHFYKKPGALTHISVFYHQYDSLKDNIQKPAGSFLSVVETHRSSLTASKNLAQKVALECKSIQAITASSVIGIPLKHLVGITAPAIVIEIGLAARDDEWTLLCSPIAKAIEAFLQKT